MSPLPFPSEPSAGTGMLGLESDEADRLGPALWLLDRVRHYSIRTEDTGVDWIRKFILHHGKRLPAGMGAAEVKAFLTLLALEG
ncbi:phage integrase N-terminal SAM-like domain-containing protein [Mesoterricola silvestris]|uniref:Integrase SAM-like N-terminal domain-containing protein n=1 Tax=Mesoterricola silvestris TaxID=2927979 RepID=A0AA48GPX6_9BACT|nr:phage integrase N-terminal SAM-like domain-containing protein [Mesoterricola silvestris]BDU73949.1 hypothetical protein METEAL_31230 [Mesoterricola silvestris]